MILYWIADSMYRSLGCNLSASRHRAGVKLWWNEMAKGQIFQTHEVEAYDPKSGDPIYRDTSEEYSSYAAESAINAYINQPTGQKNIYTATAHGVMADTMLRAGTLNPVTWCLYVLIDILFIQPFLFMWDICMMPALIWHQRTRSTLWNKEAERQRQLQLDIMSSRSLIQLYRWPVYRQW